MKALSIRQPWAWAIIHAGKRIENRDWKGCHFRGPLLIHAAQGCGVGECEDAIGSILKIDACREIVMKTWPGRVTVERGGIVGVCRVVDVVRVVHNQHHVSPYRPDLGFRCLRCDARHSDRQCPNADPWASGPLGLVLDDVRPLPFVSFKGALGFFDVPDNLVPQAMTGGPS